MLYVLNDSGYVISDAYGNPVNFCSTFIIVLAVIISIALSFYAFRSIALYKMAKKINLKNKWLIFIPFVWVYSLCKIVGDGLVFRTKCSKLALLFCLLFTFTELLSIAYLIVYYLPLMGYFYQGGEVYLSIYAFENVTSINGKALDLYYGADLGLIDCYFYTLSPSVAGGINYAYLNNTVTVRILNLIYYVSGLFDIAKTITLLSVFFALFRKYSPEHYILFGLFSVLGLFPIFAFVVRNNKPVNYADFIRAKYNAYGMGRNPYDRGYNNQNGYNPYNQAPDPFSEYSKKNESDNPFSEFDDDKN